MNYNKYNAKNILKTVEDLIEDGNKIYIPLFCDDLSIFDWWNDMLSISNLIDMRKFLKEAIKLGFDGYICFKVGITGCANGMWAYRTSTTTGYAPDSDFIYKSFTPSYNEWILSKDKDRNPLKTIKQVESMYNSLY